MELQWRWLRKMEMGKGRRWGVTIFEGEEGEVVRRLPSDGGEQHREEQHDSLRG
jgi:hypothetical protein